MKKLIVLIILCINISCYQQEKGKNNLPTKGTIKIMQKKDSIKPKFLFPDEAKPFWTTDIKQNIGLPEYNPIMTDIKYVALDNNIGYIGTIKKIIFPENRIIIHDNTRNEESVFIFDSDGVGIERIKAGGRGPTEFLGIADIYSFAGADFFVVMDNKSSRIQYFNLNGEHIKTEHSIIHTNNCNPLNDTILMYGSSFGNNYHIEELAEFSIYSGIKDSILFKGIPFAPYQKSEWKTNFFSTNYKRKIQILQHANDSIYQIINDSTYFIPYVVKFKNSLQRKIKQLPNEANFSNAYWDYVKSGYHCIETFLENKNSAIYVCTGGDAVRYLCLYDKIRDQSYIQAGIKPDYPLKMFYSGEVPLAIHNEKYVLAIPGHKIENYTKKKVTFTNNDTGEFIKETSAEIENSIDSIIQNVNENSNPVLMSFKFDF